MMLNGLKEIALAPFVINFEEKKLSNSFKMIYSPFSLCQDYNYYIHPLVSSWVSKFTTILSEFQESLSKRLQTFIIFHATLSTNLVSCNFDKLLHHYQDKKHPLKKDTT